MAPNGGGAVTGLGAALLQLNGREAVHWLLAAETAQSTGVDDRWRLSRTFAATLLDFREIWMNDQDWLETGWNTSVDTLRRLESLHIVTMDNGPQSIDMGFRVLELGDELLPLVSRPGASPIVVVVEGLLADSAPRPDHPKVTRNWGGPRSVAATVARQARLVAHEMRNALTPADFNLKRLFEVLEAQGQTQLASEYRPKVLPRLERAFDFVDQLLRASAVTAQPPERFNVEHALREALLEAANGVRVTLPDLSSDFPQLLGYRGRFVMAVANLLRNASEAHATAVQVQCAWIPGERTVKLMFQDNGPGIPGDRLGLVFASGYSTKGEGRGLGLALVKEVFEDEMGGTVRAVQPPPGAPGARFEVVLPLDV